MKPFAYFASYLALLTLAFTLGGCGGGHAVRSSGGGGGSSSAGGGYYQDDGPARQPPANLDKVPDATPQNEPLRSATSYPYTVMGKTYTPMTSLRPYKERGIASWYGKKFHGKKTASGEIYDMHKMTAASPILPIPSYVRVTNLDNGKSVVVRINDRGPFIAGRILDLSYAAAYKLDLIRQGSGPVEIELILPGASTAPPPVVATTKPAPKPTATATTTVTATTMTPTPVATAAAMPSASVATATPLAPSAPPVAAAALAPTSTPTPTPIATTTSPAMPASAPSAAPTAAATPSMTNASSATAAAPIAATNSATNTTSEIVEAPASQGIFLQLGAFGSQDNAERYATQLRAQADWLVSAVQVRAIDRLYRVRIGPFADPTEAQQVADKLSQTLGVHAITVTR